MKKIFKLLFIAIVAFICFYKPIVIVRAYNETISFQKIEVINSHNMLRVDIGSGGGGASGTLQGVLDCQKTLKNTMPILVDIFKYIRIGAAVLFVVLTSLDYIKAISSSDQSIFQKANQKVVKRVIALVSILILPTIITFVLALVRFNIGTCGIK